MISRCTLGAYVDCGYAFVFIGGYFDYDYGYASTLMSSGCAGVPLASPSPTVLEQSAGYIVLGLMALVLFLVSHPQVFALHSTRTGSASSSGT